MTDFDPKLAELIDGIPTAKNQDGMTLKEYQNQGTFWDEENFEQEDDEYGVC